MTSASLPFSLDEYASRLERTRNAMVDAGIDILIVTDPSNMSWLTGYDGWSFYVHQAVIVSLTDDPLWWGRPMDAVGCRLTSWLADEFIYAYPDNYVQNPDAHPYVHLSDILRNKGWATSRIGVEMDNYYFSAACLVTLRIALPDAKIQDATALVNWQRAVKSRQELIYMRRAGRIVEAMHQRIRDVIEPGLRKCDLVAEIYDAALRGADGFGGDYAAIVPLTPSGTDAAAAHLTWDDRLVRSGEGTFFEIAGCYKRYHCPSSRTVFLGTPPDEMMRAQDAVLEGLEAGMNAARPGATCGEVAETFFEVLRRYGVEKTSRTGYAVGLSYPPDWGERTMSFRPGDTSVIQPNMTFHFMPAIWTDDWGLEITETIRIDAVGMPECLANVPREVFIKSYDLQGSGA
jgi:ectoine hydrolase